MTASASPTHKKRFLFDFLACLLIILSHFTNYILYAGYGRLFPDLLVVLFILAAIALCLTVMLQVPSRIFRALIFAVLITIVISDALYEFGVAEISTRLIALAATLLIILALVFFLRDHATKVLMAAFLAMLTSTIVIAGLNSPDSDTAAAAAAPAAPAANDTRPVVVHLILDEHMGLAGMTRALSGGDTIRREVRNFYTQSGFRLFSHAYSQYFETAPSLATAMNYQEQWKQGRFMRLRRYGFAFKDNAYLKAYSDLNYRINIYQSNYIDFCHIPDIAITKCDTYRPDNLRSPELAGLPIAERVTLVLNMYYSSLTLFKLIKLLKTFIRTSDQPTLTRFLKPAVDAIESRLWHGRVGPLATASSFDKLVTDISRAKGGNLFFAHLLMPHYPYVYGADCALRSPVSSWSQRHLHDGTNTPASRQQHYAEYFDQTRCVMRKLQRLFDAMKRAGTFEKSIIVIHGDHGARINQSTPLATNPQPPSKTDYIDGFSTLFAIKAPGISPGMDARMAPLPHLLKFAINRGKQPLSSPVSPTIYLFNGKFDYLATPLPAFPGESN